MSDAQTELEETRKRIVELDRELSVQVAIFTQVMRAYDGSAFLGEGTGADAARAQLHELLDQTLDVKGARLSAQRRAHELEMEIRRGDT